MASPKVNKTELTTATGPVQKAVGPNFSAADAAVAGMKLGMSPKVHNSVPEAAEATAMSPKVGAASIEMNFCDALKAILDGERVIRLEWPGPEHYCLMYNHRLHIHRPDDGKIHPWIIQEADMTGEDWIILQ